MASSHLYHGRTDLPLSTFHCLRPPWYALTSVSFQNEKVSLPDTSAHIQFLPVFLFLFSRGISLFNPKIDILSC